MRRNFSVITLVIFSAVTLGIVIAPSRVVAEDLKDLPTKTYEDITQKMFDTFVKPKEANKRSGEGWAVYAPDKKDTADNEGTVTLISDDSRAKGQTAATLKFRYEPDKEKLTYWIRTRPKLGVSFGFLGKVGRSATVEEIWEGFDKTMKKAAEAAK